jgi:hypothetical protein
MNVLHCNEKSHLCIPFLETSQSQSQCSHSCVCERIYISQDRSPYFLQQYRQIDRGNLLSAHRHINVEIGIVAGQFLSWNFCFEFLVLALCSVVRTCAGCSAYKFSALPVPKRQYLFVDFFSSIKGTVAPDLISLKVIWLDRPC